MKHVVKFRHFWLWCGALSPQKLLMKILTAPLCFICTLSIKINNKYLNPIDGLPAAPFGYPSSSRQNDTVFYVFHQKFQLTHFKVILISVTLSTEFWNNCRREPRMNCPVLQPAAWTLGGDNPLVRATLMEMIIHAFEKKCFNSQNREPVLRTIKGGRPLWLAKKNNQRLFLVWGQRFC